MMFREIVIHQSMKKELREGADEAFSAPIERRRVSGIKNA